MADNFSRFWFRLVLPEKIRLVERGGRRDVEQDTSPHLDHLDMLPGHED